MHRPPLLGEGADDGVGDGGGGVGVRVGVRVGVGVGVGVRVPGVEAGKAVSRGVVGSELGCGAVVVGRAEAVPGSVGLGVPPRAPLEGKSCARVAATRTSSEVGPVSATGGVVAGAGSGTSCSNTGAEAGGWPAGGVSGGRSATRPIAAAAMVTAMVAMLSVATRCPRRVSRMRLPGEATPPPE